MDLRRRVFALNITFKLGVIFNHRVVRRKSSVIQTYLHTFFPPEWLETTAMRFLTFWFTFYFLSTRIRAFIHARQLRVLLTSLFQDVLNLIVIISLWQDLTNLSPHSVLVNPFHQSLFCCPLYISEALMSYFIIRIAQK